MRKKKNNKNSLLLLLLLLGIGFAAISVTLTITGTVKIKPGADAFTNNIKFNSVTVDETSATAGTEASISENGKTINFTTHTLKTIGETVTISYDVINTSRYAATLGGVTCTCTDDTWSTYLDVTPGDVLKDTTLATGSTVSSKDTLTISMKKSYAGENNKTYTFNCSLAATAQES